MDIVEQSIKTMLGECLRKKRLTRKAANEVIERAKKEGTDLFKYRCNYCERWHVTRMKEHWKRL